MKKYYKDCLGSYSIETHTDGTATLRCFNGGNKVKKDYKSEQAAKRALSRYCDGMPERK